MTVLPLLAAGLVMTAVAVLFVLCSIVLILVVLVQKGRGGGLSGALGGAMASGILGSKTGDFLTWATIVVAGVFLLIAVVLSKFYKPTVGKYGADQTSRQAAPAASPAGQTPAAGSPQSGVPARTAAPAGSSNDGASARPATSDGNNQTPAGGS